MIKPKILYSLSHMYVTPVDHVGIWLVAFRKRVSIEIFVIPTYKHWFYVNGSTHLLHEAESTDKPFCWRGFVIKKSYAQYNTENSYFSAMSMKKLHENETVQGYFFKWVTQQISDKARDYERL